ncbi:DnaA regulatory inactivator Hda [Venatoribacter cucullus]|uniref:DnaA regulatory inactivator Hda n=1 Tax=Venatoribacter cucullus TaxID=2661630 RepID=UPI001937951F|nr:DnaA regulatory inactivator Hda [Venatoribacter cucullus]QQD21094.1 DnaA regulatory inactivator Hda [Oceanospirillaceae bacterium ASx5O]UZK03946.1 DnaA regulatory inactivator Hda [Venatoribacter cucullus]
MNQQLTLSVAIRDDARFANYYAGPNEQIVQALQQQWTVRGEPYIYLWGSPGSGCSHLLQASCHYAEGLGHQSVYLPLDELADYGPAVLDGMDQLPLVALDHLQAVAGRSDWEEALFHLFNRIRDRQSHLLIAAGQPPAALGIQLPDLLSRLNWGVTYAVQELDDNDKILALLLRARRRGLNLSDDVARFILTRGPRDMQGLFDLLERLDAASLAAQRKLTIPFVKAELQW